MNAEQDTTKKRTPPNAGKGRPKGSKNKATELKLDLVDALSSNYSKTRIKEMCKKYELEMFKELCKLLPKEIKADVNISGLAELMLEAEERLNGNDE